MNARLKMIRESENMNQSEFAKALGMGQSTLAMLEVGKREILDRHIKTICSLFNVNEDWFRTGEGTMYNSSLEDELETIMEEKNLDAMSRKVLTAFWELPPKKREQASEFIYALSRAVMDDDINGVRTDVTRIIDGIKVKGDEKADAKMKVGLAFDSRFPYVGEGNVDIEELARTPEEIAQENARRAYEETMLEQTSKGGLSPSGSMKEA